MNILVTGGNGFLGSHLVMRLLKEEHQTTVIDHAAKSRIFNHKDKGISIYQMGAEDANCEKLFTDTQFDIVYHLAFHQPDGDGDDQALAQVHANLAGLNQMLYLALKHNVRKFIFLSSYHVYENQPAASIKESVPLQPKKLIGRHQLSREQLCQEYQQRGLNVLVMRLGCVYGPGQKPGPDSLVQRQVSEMVAKHQIASGMAAALKVYSSETEQQLYDTTMYDFIYVGDVVEALVLAISKDTPPILNIGSGHGTTQRALNRYCNQLIKSKADDQSLAQTPEEATSRRMPRHNKNTTKANAASYVLDVSLAASCLGWSPKYSLSEGIRKTYEWTIQQESKPVSEISRTKNKPLKRRLNFSNFQLRHSALIIITGLLMLLLTYFLEYRLLVKLDLLLIYVVAACLLYGMHHGVLAILLAVFARLMLVLNFESLKLVDLINQADQMMQMTLYLLLGAGIGYAIDARYHKSEATIEKLNQTTRELSFVSQLYQKSLTVKNNLQHTIENSTNSLGKLLYLINRMSQVKADSIYDEVAAVYADVLQVRDVQVYCTESTSLWLRQVAVIGEPRYGASLKVADYSFMQPLFDDHGFYINSELNPDYPMLCASISVDNQIDAVIFMNGIDFILLTQQFINTLKALNTLIGRVIENKYKNEQAVFNEKYYTNTFILKHEWFEKAVQEKTESGQHRVLLLQISNEIHNYRKFSRVISNLIRSDDYIGELDQGHLGIMLVDTDEKRFNLIQARFAEKGLVVTPLYMEVR